MLQQTRQALTVGTVIALVLGVVVTVYAVVDAASDPYGDSPWGNGMLAGPSLVVGFATIQLLWKGNENLIAQWGARIFGLNVIATALCSLAFTIAYFATPITLGRNGFHYWFGEGFAIFFPLLLGFGAALLVGLVLFVAVLLPFMAIARSRELTAANQLDTDPKYAGRNQRALIAMSVMLILVFAIPSLIVFGDDARNEVAVWIGVALIPVGVALVVYVAVVQRTDRRLRAASGTSSLPDLIADAREAKRLK